MCLQTFPLCVFYFQLTRENKDLKERCTTLEEELRICNKQLDRGNTSIQRLERDLDEVYKIDLICYCCYKQNDTKI